MGPTPLQTSIQASSGPWWPLHLNGTHSPSNKHPSKSWLMDGWPPHLNRTHSPRLAEQHPLQPGSAHRPFAQVHRIFHSDVLDFQHLGAWGVLGTVEAHQPAAGYSPYMPGPSKHLPQTSYAALRACGTALCCQLQRTAVHSTTAPQHPPPAPTFNEGPNGPTLMSL